MEARAAQRTALLRFGGVDRYRGAGREVRSFASIDNVLRDARHGLRALLRNPSFTIVAVLTLALGIGATTAVFSIVNGVLLRPLPYPDPERLVRVWEEHPGGVSPAGNRWLSRGTYAGWREQSKTIEALGGYSLLEHQVAIGGANGFKVFGSSITAAVLNTLGASPALGRFFGDEDDREGGAKVVMTGLAQRSSARGATMTLSATSRSRTVS